MAVHAYFSVKWEIVWVTATQDVPRLRKRVVEILAEVQDE
ncbi:MAG: HepT-like ribonuclease domain-containing protein [Caldilinea sp.]